MERRKFRASLDPSAEVKAAAWAWYQRGSGSAPKPMSGFPFVRPRHPPLPSRYKLEAMRMAGDRGPNQDASTATSPSTSPDHSQQASLFDAYELKRISQHLDSLVERSRKGVIHGGTSLRKEKKALKWFWARHAAVCGTADDVLETTRRSSGRRPSEKQAAVIKGESYRRRGAHA